MKMKQNVDSILLHWLIFMKY